MKENIFWRLQFYRRDKHMTQSQLAKKIGVERYSIADWEQGRSEPSISNLIALLKILDVSFEDLLGLNDIRIKDSSSETILSLIRKKD